MTQGADRKPETFDWVTARANCSIGDFFERLRNQVKNDVTLRNSSKQEKHYTFNFVDVASDCFSVTVEGQTNRAAVRFDLTADHISISAMDGLQYDVSVTLGGDGECRARIAEQTYDLWQVRKMALEDLFFRKR